MKGAFVGSLARPMPLAENQRKHSDCAPRRRAVPLALPSRPNERWSLNSVNDAFTDGRRFRTLAVVRSSPANARAYPSILPCLGNDLPMTWTVSWPDAEPRAIVSKNTAEMNNMTILKCGQETKVEGHQTPRQGDAGFAEGECLVYRGFGVRL
jgi:hypothetical protein